MITFHIGNRIITSDSRPYIIAEAGVNHENSIEIAERMIVTAALAGANAVKFQTYKSEKLAAADSPVYWNSNMTQKQFFAQYDRFRQQEHEYLAQVCQREKVDFLSTPFDKEAVDLLEPLVPVYKIASADITNKDLLCYVASKNKPVILSTGASTLSEIARAVEWLRDHGTTEIALLHCILHYPAHYKEINLKSIQHLQECFPKCVIGYSDHTYPDPGMSLLTAAAVVGAKIIEKHYTLDKTKSGNDHYHAMDQKDLQLLSSNMGIIYQSLGNKKIEITAEELPARKYARRSVVTTMAVPQGQPLTRKHITCKRPGTGIKAEEIDYVIGRRPKANIPSDTILQWSMLE